MYARLNSRIRSSSNARPRARFREASATCRAHAELSRTVETSRATPRFRESPRNESRFRELRVEANKSRKGRAQRVFSGLGISRVTYVTFREHCACVINVAFREHNYRVGRGEGVYSQRTLQSLGVCVSARDSLVIFFYCLVEAENLQK